MGQLVSKLIGSKDISLDDIVIIVIGPSGTGKSTFINTAAEKPLLTVNSGLEPCTTKVEHVRCTIQVKGSLRNVVFVDTPAFPDPGDSNNVAARLDVELKIRRWLRKTCDKGVEVAGILYLYKITENRMTGPPLRDYRMFQDLCGEGFHARVLLVTTMWRLVKQDIGERRENELTRHWSEMIDNGSAVVRYDGSGKGAWDVVKKLVG